jgi:hypothetical protein
MAQPKHRKMDMRFGTGNVRSLYRSGSLKTVARELGKYKLDLGGVSEWILGRLAWGVDWIRLSQDRDLWRAVVSAVMNLRVLVPRS